MRRTPLLLCLTALAGSAGASALSAQGVLIAPTTIIIDARARSAELQINNPGDSPVEVSVGDVFFGYPVTDSAGKFDLRTVEAPDSTMPSAAGWLQAYPRLVTLGGREHQVVRLLARAPNGLKDGEYWARLVVSARNQPPATTGPVDSNGVSVGLNLEVRTVLPVLFRKGAVSTGVRIDSLSLSRVEGDSLEFHARLTRTGNAAYIGQIRAAVVDSSGTVVASTRSPIAVYFEMSPRGRMVCGALPPGRYRLRFELSTDREDIPPNERISAAPVSDSVEVRLP